MAAFYLKMKSLKNLIANNFIAIFALLFYTSWVYEIRAMGDYGALFGSIKQVIILAIVILMLVSIRWRSVKFDLFSLACGLWLMVNILEFAEHLDPVNRYIRALGQTVFFYLFVTFLRQNPDKNPCSSKALKIWFFPWVVFVTLVVIIILYLAGNLSADVINGFGNSRVNFSIWLIQVVALVIFGSIRVCSTSMKVFFICLILLTPAFVLQNMTGGRSGVLGTFLLVSLFAYRWGGIKPLVLSIFWLFLIAFLVSSISPEIRSENNLNIFRNIPLLEFEYSTSNEVIALLDRITSYRVSILLTAFSSLSINGFLFGNGLGNFVGWAPTYPELGIMEVHNVPLKILGEYGIGGGMTALFLMLLPFFSQKNQRPPALYLQFVYLMVAMVHPDLMFTAVNTSLVYFACYADSLDNSPLS